MNKSYEDIRVYAVNLNELDDLEDDPRQWDTDKFIDKAEELGFVWSLSGFQEAFNNDDISDQWYIKII